MSKGTGKRNSKSMLSIHSNIHSNIDRLSTLSRHRGGGLAMRSAIEPGALARSRASTISPETVVAIARATATLVLQVLLVMLMTMVTAIVVGMTLVSSTAGVITTVNA